MKMGIISDTHDRIDNLKKALNYFEKEKITSLIHCGDFCAPFMMDELAKFQGEVYCVFGNVDDRYLTTKKALENKINLYGDLAEFNFENRKIAVNHFPEIAENLASSGKYDAVFYGHTHVKEKRKIKNLKLDKNGLLTEKYTLLLNPGELMGRLGKISLAIYNTETNDAEIIDIE